MQQTLWERIKKLSPVTWAAPRDNSGKHIGSVLGDKIVTRAVLKIKGNPVPVVRYTGKIANLGNGERFRVYAYKHGENYGRLGLTQHDRVAMRRAGMRNMTLAQYEAAYPSTWKLERAYDEYLNGLMAANERQMQVKTSTDEIPF